MARTPEYWKITLPDGRIFKGLGRKPTIDATVRELGRKRLPKGSTIERDQNGSTKKGHKYEKPYSVSTKHAPRAFTVIDANGLVRSSVTTPEHASTLAERFNNE